MEGEKKLQHAVASGVTAVVRRPAGSRVASAHVMVEVGRMGRCGDATGHGDHPLPLYREHLLVVVTYSSSGRHSSGWNSGLRK